MSSPAKLATLRRDAAHQLIDDTYTTGGREASRKALQDLAAHWDISGHWNDHATRDEWYYALHEYVNQQADANSDDADTGLTAPQVQP